MDSVPPWRAQAVITLSNLDQRSPCAHPERSVSLTRDHATIQIGRTSKRNATFEALKSNCWFDSAVMSREHAQLRFDAKEQKVYITDAGSLHGTYLNEHPLTPHDSQELRDGDILRFGISIERGRDVYNPIAMEVAIRYGGTRLDDQPTIFRVPDDTDVEDVSGDEESSIQHSTKLLQQNNIRPARSPTTSHPISIDLTGNDQNPVSNTGPENHKEMTKTTTISIDDTKNSPSSSHIDLTSQCDEEPKEGLDRTDMHTFEATIQDAEVDPHRPVEISDVFDEIEETVIPMGVDSDSDVASVSDAHSTSSESNILDDASQSEEEGSSSIMAHEDDIEDHSDSAEDEDFSCSEHDSFLDDASMEELDGLSEHAEMAAPCATLAPIRAEHVTADVPQGDQAVVEQEPQPTIPPQCLWASPLPPMMTEMQRLPNFSEWNTMPAADPTNVRLPSIAAAVSGPPQLLVGENVHSTAEALGAKTGKYEYFYAREDNKAVHQNDSPVLGHDSVSSPQPSLVLSSHGASNTTPSEGLAQDMETSAHYNPWCSEPHSSNTADTPGPWSSSGKMFLSSPPTADTCEIVQNLQNIPLDETSAYQYEVSKKAVCAQFVTPQGRRMTIDNLVDPPSDQPQPPKSSAAIGAVAPDSPASGQKRKAYQISELTPEEQGPKEQVKPFNGPASTNISASPSISSPALQATEQARATPSRTMSGRELVRPVKRLRRMAEVVGIAAIGGAFVMSALIATAPAL